MSGPLQFTGELDLARMHRARHDRLVEVMRAQGVDALVLLGQQNVAYATGTRVPAADQGRALHRRPIALLTADGEAPRVWTWYPEGAPADLDRGHVQGGLDLEWDDGACALLAEIPGGTVAVDEYTMPLASTNARPASRAAR